jgi:predicted TIM-barrel fold metal-dependent hydrolase
MDAMGIDKTILFPNNMLDLGLHPVVLVEVAVARAYAIWMTEEILPASDSRIKTLLYLPFNDPDACLRIVEEFGDRQGVVGFVVGSIRHNGVHDNAYMLLYEELERRQMPLGFHGSWHPSVQTDLFNNMLSVHALGFPYHIMVNMTNWVVNGLPERFPGLRTIWIEGGLAYLPFVMQRLDHEYLMRTSEAPLLRKRPSDYIREFFFTSQPLEVPLHDLEPLKATFALINAETQLLYASDYPHWDFDLPSRIYDLPFLSNAAKRRILGQNAFDLFKLDRR